jgi:hypothetical protein
MILELAGGLSLAAWIYLLAGRGGFWYTREAREPEMERAKDPRRGVW